MKTKLLVLLALFAMPAIAFANMGHRMGSDYLTSLPENSLAVLEASANGLNGNDPIMDDSGYVYSEFDVQETYDNEVILFHDKGFKRMLPNKGRNVETYKQIIANIKQRTGKKYKFKKLRVKHLTLEEIQSLYLKGGDGEERVPSLKEVFELAVELRVTKPMVVEYKKIRSDIARAEMLRLMTQYKEDHGDSGSTVYTDRYDYPQEIPVMFLGFPKNFPNFSLKDEFCDDLRDLGFGFYRAKKHSIDLCANYGNGKNLKDDKEEKKQTKKKKKKKSRKKKKRSWWKVW